MKYKDARFIIRTYEKDINSGRLKDPDGSIRKSVEEARKVTNEFWRQKFKRL